MSTLPASERAALAIAVEAVVREVLREERNDGRRKQRVRGARLGWSEPAGE